MSRMCRITNQSEKSCSSCCEKLSVLGWSGDLLDGDLFDGDLVAERFEPADAAAFYGILISTVEEVGAEVVVGAAVLEEVVGDDEDRVGDGDGGLVGAPTGGEA